MLSPVNTELGSVDINSLIFTYIYLVCYGYPITNIRFRQIRYRPLSLHCMTAGFLVFGETR